MSRRFEHGGLGYLQIPALDITSSARFYERLFGWRVAPPEAGFEAPGLIGQWVTDRRPAPDAGPVGWFHVDDLEGALVTAEDAGGSVAATAVEDGPRLLASVLDPAGNRVGIVQVRRGLTGDGPGRAPAAGGNRTMPDCSVIAQLVYDDVPQAIDWLCDTFGLVERWRVGDHRAQLAFGRCAVAVTEPRTSEVLPGPVSLLVRVEDAAAHHERVLARGARVVQELKDHSYGERQFTVEDLGGHHWCFSQSVADVAPEEWGGISGPALHGAPRPRVPREAPAISVMLIVPDAAAAVDWYERALSAEVLWDLGGVAGLEVQGAAFFLHEVNPSNPSETSPAHAGVTSTRIELFVDDPDAVVACAVEAGATPGSEVVDHEVPWGTHRQGGFRDPFGHRWSVGDPSPLRSALG